MTITSKVIPGAGGQTPQEKLAAKRNVIPELDDNIVAKPLSMPDSDNIRLKDKSFELRWVNYSVGEKESSLRYHQMKASGYSNVTPAEIESGLAASYETMDGKIINGDVILMKIKKEAIQGAKKYNWQKAMRRRGMRAAGQQGRDIMREDLGTIGASRTQLNKISTFVPGAKELESLVGQDSK